MSSNSLLFIWNWYLSVFLKREKTNKLVFLRDLLLIRNSLTALFWSLSCSPYSVPVSVSRNSRTSRFGSIEVNTPTSQIVLLACLVEKLTMPYFWHLYQNRGNVRCCYLSTWTINSKQRSIETNCSVSCFKMLQLKF